VDGAVEGDHDLFDTCGAREAAWGVVVERRACQRVAKGDAARVKNNRDVCLDH